MTSARLETGALSSSPSRFDRFPVMPSPLSSFMVLPSVSESRIKAVAASCSRIGRGRCFNVPGRAPTNSFFDCKTVAASARGADGGRAGHLTAPRFAVRCGSSFTSGDFRRNAKLLMLERQQHVEHLAAVSWLLDIGDLAVAAIGDASLCNLARIDGVI